MIDYQTTRTHARTLSQYVAPKGWRSWNCYHGDVNDAKIRFVVDAVVVKARKTHEGKMVSLIDLGHVGPIQTPYLYKDIATPIVTYLYKDIARKVPLIYIKI